MQHEQHYPWENILQLSYSKMGLLPDIFWAMTPCEWMQLATQLPDNKPGFSKEEVAELAALLQGRQVL